MEDVFRVAPKRKEPKILLFVRKNPMVALSMPFQLSLLGNKHQMSYILPMVGTPQLHGDFPVAGMSTVLQVLGLLCPDFLMPSIHPAANGLKSKGKCSE